MSCRDACFAHVFCYKFSNCLCLLLSYVKAVNMEGLHVNQTLDPLVIVKENRVESTGHQFKRYSYHFLHFFLKTLFSIVKCRGLGGGEHPRFALHLPSNQVFVFDGCMGEKGETAFYIPYLDETTTPFRLPEVGDPVVTGIKWLSKAVPCKNSVVSGCLFDMLLVDLKVRTLAQKVCLNCLFTYSSGPGFLLEQLIRTVICHILVFAQPIGKSKYERIRIFTAEEDLKIRRVWFDKKCLFLASEHDVDLKRVVEKVHYCSQGN